MFLKNAVTHSVILLAMVAVLSACQSTPPVSQQKAQQQKATSRQTTSSTTLEVTRRTVPVIKSVDGIQDIQWTITQIQGKKALFFSEMPKVALQSQNRRFIGNTGCNALYGSYEIDVSKQTIEFKASAGHQMCNNALAQEADLMDALARVQYFQLQHKTIRFMDRNRQVLIQAEQ